MVAESRFWCYACRGFEPYIKEFEMDKLPWNLRAHAAEDKEQKKRTFTFTVAVCTCGGEIVFERRQVSRNPGEFWVGPGSTVSFDECYCAACGMMFHQNATRIKDALATHLKKIDDEVDAEYATQRVK